MLTMKKYSLLLLALVIIFIAWKTRGIHQITRVKDGDTFVIDDKETIRLCQIDAPEKLQSFGDSAKLFADSCLLNKDVRIVRHGKDIYRRTIADVYLSDGTYFNELLVKRGFAWTTNYTTKRRIEKDMAIAMKDSVGLWHYPPYESPSDWRKQHKK